jgi:hypothetical protein
LSSSKQLICLEVSVAIFFVCFFAQVFFAGPIASAAVALAGMTKVFTRHGVFVVFVSSFPFQVPITSPIKKPSRAALALTEAVAPAPSVIPVSDLKVNAEGGWLPEKFFFCCADICPCQHVWF